MKEYRSRYEPKPIYDTAFYPSDKGVGEVTRFRICLHISPHNPFNPSATSPQFSHYSLQIPTPSTTPSYKSFYIFFKIDILHINPLSADF